MQLSRGLAVFAVALLCAGCADRTLRAEGDGDSAFDDEGLDVGAEAETTAQGPGDPARGYIRDCRPVLAMEDSDSCGVGQGATYGPARGSAIPESACGVCICADACDSDAECPIGHSAAVPRCVLIGVENIRTCVLSCDVDTDCEVGMLCLPARWGGTICQWAMEKPGCCEGESGC